MSANHDRPGTLKAATWLWFGFGMVFLLLGVAAFAQVSTGLARDPIILLGAPLAVLLGIVFLALARLLRRGRDTRIALAVLGVVLLIFALVFVRLLAVVFLLVVVPAIVLQYRPEGGRWLTSAKTAR